MKIRILLTTGAVFLAGALLFAPLKVFAHGNNQDHINHDLRKQQDHARHDAGISWQQDRVIHGQERQQHRLDHQAMNNGYAPGYYDNAYSAGYVGNGYYQPTGTGLSNRLRNWFGTGTGYIPNGYYSGINSGYGYGNAYAGQYYNGAVSGYGTVYNTTQNGQNGHVYTPDGHRLDHHGNHDDGPGDF